jgi:hypothetical protein
MIEQEIKRPIFTEQPRVLPRYKATDFELTERQRLDKVRRELAALPVVLVAEKQAEEVQQEPKTMGEAFMDLLLGFIGLTLTKTGEFMESFGEKK